MGKDYMLSYITKQVNIQYLNLAKEDRIKVCENVVRDTLKQINAPATMEQKRMYMIRKLEEFIFQYQIEEKYELCLIFKDIIEVLKTDYNYSEEIV
jgi:hypothetical protein